MSEATPLIISPNSSASVGERALSLAWAIDLGLTVASHGWVHLEPWRWEGDTGTLLHAERIGDWVGAIRVRQRDPQTLTVAWDGFSENAAAEILRRAARWVSAEWNPAAAIAALGPAFPTRRR